MCSSSSRGGSGRSCSVSTCLRDGEVVLVDWNHARLGNPALDLVAWLPSLTLEGGPPPAELARNLPGVDELAVVAAGFFAAHAGLPPPPGAPLVRGFQLAQARVSLDWTCAVLGLEPPDGL